MGTPQTEMAASRESEKQAPRSAGRSRCWRRASTLVSESWQGHGALNASAKTQRAAAALDPCSVGTSSGETV